MWSMVMFVFYFYLPLSASLKKSNVVFAVNAGGDTWIDSNGILYENDDNKMGINSDIGKELRVLRVNYHDRILYKTVKYFDTTCGYKIPIVDDGNYVMVLKFSEIEFLKRGARVFDIVLNNQHTIVSNLDIFRKVGWAIAHHEYIEFKVDREKLYWGEEVSEIKSNTIQVDFIKGEHGNPSICAILLAKGNINDVPKLPGPVKAKRIKEKMTDRNTIFHELFGDFLSFFSKKTLRAIIILLFIIFLPQLICINWL